MCYRLLKNNKQNGFISLIVCFYFSIFTILILNLCLASLSHINYCNHLTHYTFAYCEALSGLRSINEITKSHRLIINFNEPILDDFYANTRVKIESFKFNIYKSTQYIYSFSQKNDAICILKARYRIENSIMILSELSYFFRR